MTINYYNIAEQISRLYSLCGGTITILQLLHVLVLSSYDDKETVKIFTVVI